MKFNLLVAASALAVGLSFSGMAYAGGGDGGNGGNGGGHQQTSVTNTALAGAIQLGEVEHNFAKGTDANNGISSGSFNGATGLFNVQQNGGANSLQQDGNTLAAVLNCTCSNTTGTTNNTPIALSAQVASVEGNASLGAANTTTSVTHSEYVSKKGEDKHHHGDSGSFSAGESFGLYKTSYAVASSNSIGGSFENATGLFNVSQNVGNNSMQQATNTVAAIVGK
jgi:hypothetical protein